MAENRELFYRRLHSQWGVIPIEIFLIRHLVVNHFDVYGEARFNKAAAFMHVLPLRADLDTFIIFLPILFHAILGVYIVFVTKNNTRHYSYFRNWMFHLQQVTGIITLVFIAWHVWETRVQIGMGNAELNYGLMEGILS